MLFFYIYHQNLTFFIIFPCFHLFIFTLLHAHWETQEPGSCKDLFAGLFPAGDIRSSLPIGRWMVQATYNCVIHFCRLHPNSGCFFSLIDIVVVRICPLLPPQPRKRLFCKVLHPWYPCPLACHIKRRAGLQNSVPGKASKNEWCIMSTIKTWHEENMSVQLLYLIFHHLTSSPSSWSLHPNSRWK